MVAGSTPTGSAIFYHGFDHEIFSTVILPLPLIQEGQLPVSGERMSQYCQACQVKVWLGKLTALDMAHWIYWAVKPQHKQTKLYGH